VPPEATPALVSFRTLASLCVWLAYLVIPVEGWGLFHGRPLGLLGAAALAAAWWVAFARGSPKATAIVAMALVLKVLIGGALIVPRGFAAQYFANATFAGPVERSAEPADPAATRTDHQLRFGFENGVDVPLAFFNDLRFNYYRDGDPDRATLPFSVSWLGLWRVTKPGAQPLYARSPGGAVQIVIGDAFSARVEPGEYWTGAPVLPTGQHRLAIAWAVPAAGARQIEVGRIVDGREVPFDDSVVVRHRASALALAADAGVRAVSTAFDAFLAAWLLLEAATTLGSVYRRVRSTFNPHGALVLVWALGIADALAFAAPHLDRMTTLTAGNDWLTYESQARDIVLNGLWMNEGARFGQGRPFYYQPFYSYFLAACHWLFGDGLFGPHLVQRLFLTASVVVLWRTVALLLDEAAGLAAFVAALVVVYQKYAFWAPILLTENLFVPLVCWWVYTLVRLVSGPPSKGRAFVAGVVGGLAALTRSSLLLGWIAVIPALAIAIGRGRRRVVLLTILVSTMVAVGSLATLRNWVVAGRVVAISSEGPVVLFLGNSTPSLEMPPAHQVQYERLHLDSRLQAVAEYVRQQPRAFAHGLWRKALYTLGWFDQVVPGSGTSIFYIATWLSALIGVVLLLRTQPRERLALASVPLLVAASHFAAVVVFQPHVYGDRLIMPLYVLLVPYVGVTLIACARAAPVRLGERLPAALWASLLLAAIARATGWLAGIDLEVLAVAVMACGLCLAGLPEPRGARLAVYAAYAVALASWLVRMPAANVLAACQLEWLFLLIALASGALWPGTRARETGGAPEFLSWSPAALRVVRGLAFVLGGALAVAGLRMIGVPVFPDHALLRGRIAAFGFAGAAAYALVWVDGWWPRRGGAWMLLANGVVCGAFAFTLVGGELGAAGSAVLVVAGLIVGAARAEKVRAGSGLPSPLRRTSARASLRTFP
jgi:hypothetical protein